MPYVVCKNVISCKVNFTESPLTRLRCCIGSKCGGVYSVLGQGCTKKEKWLGTHCVNLYVNFCNMLALMSFFLIKFFFFVKLF